MTLISSSQLFKRAGNIVQLARRGPIAVEHRRKQVAVIVSMQEWQALLDRLSPQDKKAVEASVYVSANA